MSYKKSRFSMLDYGCNVLCMRKMTDLNTYYLNLIEENEFFRKIKKSSDPRSILKYWEQLIDNYIKSTDKQIHIINLYKFIDNVDKMEYDRGT